MRFALLGTIAPLQFSSDLNQQRVEGYVVKSVPSYKPRNDLLFLYKKLDAFASVEEKVTFPNSKLAMS